MIKCWTSTGKFKIDKITCSKSQCRTPNDLSKNNCRCLYCILKMIWKLQICRNFQKQSPGGVCRKGVPRHSAKFTVKHLCPRPQAATLLKKETEAQVFLCECCVISENTLFYRTPPGDCFWTFSVHNVRLWFISS